MAFCWRWLQRGGRTVARSSPKLPSGRAPRPPVVGFEGNEGSPVGYHPPAGVEGVCGWLANGHCSPSDIRGSTDACTRPYWRDGRLVSSPRRTDVAGHGCCPHGPEVSPGRTVLRGIQWGQKDGSRGPIDGVSLDDPSGRRGTLSLLSLPFSYSRLCCALSLRGVPRLRGGSPGHDSYLVDSASSHMLVSKIKPCMSKYKRSIR